MSLSNNFNNTPDLQKALQNVIAHPDDDSARLAYADLLPDSEKDRKEYIRNAIYLSKKGLVSRDNAEDMRIVASVLTWEAKHRADGFPIWDSKVASGIHSCRFNRGFVEHVAIDANAFAENADIVMAAGPVRHLDLIRLDKFDKKPFPRSLFSNPALKGIRSLKITKLSDDDMQALATSPYLKELRWLDLSGTRISYKGVEALVKNKANLPKLDYADLRGTCDLFAAVYYDQGVAVDRSTGEDRKWLEAEYGRQPWMTRDDYQDRFDDTPPKRKPRSPKSKANKGLK